MVASFKRGSARHTEPIFEALLSQNSSKHLLSSENIYNDPINCSCERSASAHRRLHNYLRCTQTEERLSALALIHLNYESEMKIDTVCKLFFQ